MKKRALISVSDKTGVVEFASELNSLGYEVISTGGTYKAISEAGVSVINVSDITGFPECLDGRVKTLHPNIHAGILAMRSNPEHMEQLKKLGVDTIDIVAINLYPFRQTIMKDNVELKDAIENIDIGGPTMIRAAAKNYQDVAVIVDPSDYKTVIEELKGGGVSQKTKFKLAYKVFEHTASYDTLISEYLRKQIGEEMFPNTLSVTYEKAQEMRYGENPHQQAVFYKEISKYNGGIASAKQLHGKELSYNNINDTNGAIEIVKEFDCPAVVAVKHANPCGVGIGDNVYDAYIKAYKADSISIFGGIVATNCEIDQKTAVEMSKIFLEIIIAPSFTKDALEVLSKKKNIRLLELKEISKRADDKYTFDMKKVLGGLLVQQIDSKLFLEDELVCVTDKKPTEKEVSDLRFAWKVVKHTKSNAIVLAKDNMTIGVGPGQPNRITAANIAINNAKGMTKGAVMASDAFFPFPDCVEAAAKAGITAIIQPGGSVRDQESIDACNKLGIAMLFCGMRHFKH